MSEYFVIAWPSEWPEYPPAFLMDRPATAHTVEWGALCWMEPGHSMWEKTPLVKFQTREEAEAWLVADALEEHPNRSRWARMKIPRDIVPMPGINDYLFGWKRRCGT